MAAIYTYVGARIDSATKAKATEALESMGLSISGAIRLFMLQIAAEQCLPFSIEASNATTKEAIAELEEGKGHCFDTADDLKGAL